LSGNVFEWVEDCVHINYKGALADGSAWLKQDNGKCDDRVIRGGSWSGNPVYLRASARYGFRAVGRDNNVGFRLAQDTPQ
jgi:formylglycine-generating enzyme required for sulfatase activity